jgi:hypothetical protein
MEKITLLYECNPIYGDREMNKPMEKLVTVLQES